MDITFGGRMTKGQWRKACLLHVWPSKTLLVLLILFLGSNIPLALLSTDPQAALSSVVIMYVFVALIVPAVPLVTAEVQWRSDRGLREPVEGVASEEAIRIRFAHADTRVPWADMYRFKESKDLVLLYRTPQNRADIPRSFFASEAEWQQFRALIHSKVAGPSRGAVRAILLFAALWLASWMALWAVGYGF